MLLDFMDDGFASFEKFAQRLFKTFIRPDFDVYIRVFALAHEKPPIFILYYTSIRACWFSVNKKAVEIFQRLGWIDSKGQSWVLFWLKINSVILMAVFFGSATGGCIFAM